MSTEITIAETVHSITIEGDGDAVTITGGGDVIVVTDAGAPGVEGDPGPPGASAARARQHASGVDGANALSYVGIAALGSATSAAVWTIRRLTFDQAGALIASATATASPAAVWDNYATEGYS